MQIDRRSLMAFAASLALTRSVRAETAVPAAIEPEKEILLWPKRPPGGIPKNLVEVIVTRNEPAFTGPNRAVDHVTHPKITVFPAPKPNGSAILIAPGGAYAHVVVDKEGTEIARLFASRGTTAFVLAYRLPFEGWAGGPDTPLQDSQRALRLARSQAAHYRFDAERLGVIGFSAGGHLAASLATRFNAKVYKSVDAHDKLSARPNFAALIYPVITMGEEGHAGSRKNLLGDMPTAEAIAAYSAERGVTAQSSPSFLVHAADDATVPVNNSIMMFSALKAAGVPAEMHIFEKGGHGFGLRGVSGLPAAAWPDLFLAWAASHKM